jgi:hypothetical protein
MSNLTDAQLDAVIAKGVMPQQAPVATDSDVMKGLLPSEQDRMISDPAFASTALQNTQRYLEQTAQGVNPLATGDYGLWQYQRRAQETPGFWASVGAGVKGVVTGAAATAEQADEIAIKAGSGNATDAAQQTDDLALTAGAKALSFNNSLVRNWSIGVQKLATKIQSVGEDQQTKDYLENQYERSLFEAQTKNYQDDQTASTISQHAVDAVQALAPQLAQKPLAALADADVGHTDVDQDAASFLSTVPQMMTEAAIAKGASVLSASTSAAQAGVAATAYRAAVDALGEARTVHATAQTALTAAISNAAKVGGDGLQDALNYAKSAAADVAKREGAVADLSTKAAQAATDATTQAGKVGAVRQAAGSVLGTLGTAAAKTGQLIDKVTSLPDSFASKFAPESDVVQKYVAGTVRAAAASALGYAVGGDEGFVGGVIAGAGGLGLVSKLIQGGGADAIRLGDIFSAGQATLPFWRNVRMAEGISGFSKQAATYMDNSVISAASRVIPAATEGAVKAGAFGAGLGILTNPDDPLSGAGAGLGSGATVGAAMGAFGQWRSYADPMQIAAERAGQLRVYNDTLAARPGEQKIFNQLPTQTQEGIANYLAARPDLKVRYVNDPGLEPGNYDSVALPDEVTVNLAAKDPLQDIVGHEIGHFIANHALGDAVNRQLLGDANAGIPGDYTARDPVTNEPVVVTAPDGSKTYQPNDAFQAISDNYAQSIRNTALARGWSEEKLNATLAQTKDPSYIASEIFAEQHLKYLQSPQYRDDLQGTQSANDFILNHAFLKNTLGALGVTFDTAGTIHSPILGSFQPSGAVDNMIRDYTQRQATGKSGSLDFAGGDTTVDEQSLTKGTGYAERYFDATGDILRDPQGNPIYDGNTGRAVLAPKGAADADARKGAVIIREALDKLAASGVAQDPNAVQKRTTVDGRTTYAGRFLPDSVIEAIAKSGHYNSIQTDNIRQINGEMKAGLGKEWNSFYQAATRKGAGGTARSLAGRWRTDLGYGWQVSDANNLLLQSVSLEGLQNNAAQAVRKGTAGLWNNNLGELLEDTHQYLGNLASGVPGETGLAQSPTAALEKKNFIQNLLGIRIKAHGDVNPLYETTNAPKTVLTSLRVDRMNRVSPISGRNVPFSTDSYQRAAKNLTPDRYFPDVDIDALLKPDDPVEAVEPPVASP